MMKRLFRWSVFQVLKFLICLAGVRTIIFLLLRYLKQKGDFYFQGQKLPYFFHSYNNFRITERTIEIPIVSYYLGKQKFQNILEIGNVTKHYYDDFKNFTHKDTIDKYEIAYDVINVDIRDFKPQVGYDFIYSISTFEHMDSDGGRNPEYDKTQSGSFSSVAMQNIKYVTDRLLKTGGIFLLTFPLQYCNGEIDISYKNGELDLLQAEKVTSWILWKKTELEWVEVKKEDYFNNKYFPKYDNVNFLCIVEIRK